MPRGEKIGDDVAEQVVRLRSQGVTLRQISEALGVPLTSAQRLAKKAGLCNPHHKVKAPAVTKRRPRNDSTHVPHREKIDVAPEVIEAILEEKPVPLLKPPEVPTVELDPDRERMIQDAAKTGDIDYAASVLVDGLPDEWRRLGELVTPDFLPRWKGSLLLYHLSSGMHRQIALARCGIRLGDYETWLGYASNGKEPFAGFLRLCSAAQASACVNIQRQIAAKMPGWQALAWTLEKLSPEIYARRMGPEQVAQESGLSEVGDEALKRTALAAILDDNDHRALDVEFVDLEEIEGRTDG